MEIKRFCPIVVAHRGASAKWPENTISAFEGARSLGADWVEFDVRRSADRHLVVVHDAHVGRRAVAETAAADLDSSIPSLAEALTACAGMGVNVEIKNDPGEPGYDRGDDLPCAVVVVMSGHLDPDRSLVTCFDRATIDRVRSIDKRWPTGFLTWRRRETRDLAELAAGGHAAINPMDRLVNADLIERAHNVGLTVNVWTVDDPRRIRELADLGADGIITNVPDVALAALREQ